METAMLLPLLKLVWALSQGSREGKLASRMTASKPGCRRHRLISSPRWILFIIGCCLIAPTAGTRWGRPAAATVIDSSEAVAAFAAVSDMSLQLKNKLQGMEARLDDIQSNVHDLRPWRACRSGLGWVDHSELWLPWPPVELFAGSADGNGSEFIPGADEHLTKGK